MNAKAKLKFTILSLGIGSAFAFIGLMQEKSIYSTSFMKRSSVVIEKRLDDSYARVVASEEKEEVRKEVCPIISRGEKSVHDKLISSIDGDWDIKRLFVSENSVTQEEIKNNYGSESNIEPLIVGLEYKGNCIVRAFDESQEEFYRIAYYEHLERLALKRDVEEDKVEVLELFKVKEEKVKEESSLVEETIEEEKVMAPEGITVNGVKLIDGSYRLERAMVPSNNKGVLANTSEERGILEGSLEIIGHSVTIDIMVESKIIIDRFDFGSEQINPGAMVQTIDKKTQFFFLNAGTGAYMIRIGQDTYRFLHEDMYEAALEKESLAREKARRAKEEADANYDYDSEIEPTVEQEAVEQTPELVPEVEEHINRRNNRRDSEHYDNEEFYEEDGREYKEERYEDEEFYEDEDEFEDEREVSLLNQKIESAGFDFSTPSRAIASSSE